MAGIFDHIHLKRHTAGSSNELSLDVLDAARSDLDAKENKSKRFGKAKAQYKGSYHGVMGAATYSSKPEVERRKHDRKAHSHVLWVGGALVVVAVASAFVWFGYQHYLDVQKFNSKLDGVVEQFIKQDELLIQVDNLMEHLDDEEKHAEMASVANQIPDAVRQLEDVEEQIMSIQTETNDSESAALKQAAETAKARMNMFTSARQAFFLTSASEEQAENMTKIWNKVITGVQSAKSAAHDANEATTEEETKSAREKTVAAKESLSETLAELKAFAEKNKDLDCTAEIQFLEMKIESLELAIETSDALLEGNRDLANEKNTSYNKIDQRAAEYAKNLPLSMETMVEGVYESGIEGCVARYSEARNRVIESDARVREYLAKN